LTLLTDVEPCLNATTMVTARIDDNYR